jgi:regulator of cell morphogenesis and NO signaling
MDITPATQVADIASRFPATIKVFQRLGVDFCCGGRRPLAEVCEGGGPSYETLRAGLQEAIAGAPPEPRPVADLPLDELTGHIVDRYHRWIREELARVAPMMEKVLGVHGERHPELGAVARTFAELQQDILPHMMKEEQVLFPFLGRLATTPAEAPLAVPFGSVENPIRMMEMEHEAVGGLLARLRGLTGGFTAPDDACNTFRGLYHAFADIERDTHEHIHVENNILHPRAIALERKRRATVMA